MDIVQATDECGDSVAVLEFPKFLGMKTSLGKEGKVKTYVGVDTKLVVVPALVEVFPE